MLTKTDERTQRDIMIQSKEGIMTAQPPTPPVPLAEAAEALGVSERTLQRYVRSGAVPVIELSAKRRFVPGAFIDAFLAGDAARMAELTPPISPAVE